MIIILLCLHIEDISCRYFKDEAPNKMDRLSFTKRVDSLASETIFKEICVLDPCQAGKGHVRLLP